MDVATTLKKPVLRLFLIESEESFNQNVFTFSNQEEYEHLCNSNPFFTQEVQKDIKEFLQKATQDLDTGHNKRQFSKRTRGKQ